MKRKNSINLNEDQREIVRFLIIVGVIVILAFVFYFISLKIKEKNVYHYDEISEGTINYDKVNIGTMLNKKDKEYYVALYKSDADNVLIYFSLLSIYAGKEKALKIYYCDMSSPLNKEYYVENDKTNPNAKTIDELKVGDFTLLKIKNGKINKYLENLDKVKEELNI